MKRRTLCLLALFCLSLTGSIFAQETAPREPAASTAGAIKKPAGAIRIFLKTGNKKTYVRGYQWMTLDLNRKISLVESARRGAVKMNAVMVLPAETYVDEVNKFFQDNPRLMQMEVGQVIQGIAISLKDWDDGSQR